MRLAGSVVARVRMWVIRCLGSRVVARAAVAGAAAGLVTLATLSVLASMITGQATARVRSEGEVINVWSDISVRISAEHAALGEFLATGGAAERRASLVASVYSASGGLDWLAKHKAADPEELDLLEGAYANYNRIVVDLIAMNGQGVRVQEYTAQAARTFAPLHEQVLDYVDRRKAALGVYLAGVDHRTKILRELTSGVIAVDAVLFAICIAVIVGYQRRTERQSADRLHDAIHDPLTGLGNRSFLTERMQRAIRESNATGEPFSLLLIDLDRFKEVNDTLGHHCGDELLCGVARRLTEAARPGNAVARLGGDEFAVIMPGVQGRAEAAAAATRLLDAMRRPMSLDGVTVDIDGSIGVATYPLDSGNAADLLRHADVAMYVAKRSHLGVSAYDPSRDEHYPNRLTLQSDLRQGIARGELVVHYQPKIDLTAGHVIGVEALVRWQHPDYGLLAPDTFLPMAEETGLIELVTQNVLDQALAQVSEWLQAGLRLSVAINVTARSVLDDTFPSTVLATLARHHVPAELLTLEITENVFITDPDRAGAILQQLRDHDVDISIDDFGTGYSSIAHLRAMPPHEIKIDRSFVTTICADPRNEGIVRAIIDLAKSLNLTVVAEGVEDQPTVSALRTLGCHNAQGFHISRPLPAADFVTWLGRHKPQPAAGTPDYLRTPAEVAFVRHELPL